MHRGKSTFLLVSLLRCCEGCLNPSFSSARVSFIPPSTTHSRSTRNVALSTYILATDRPPRITNRFLHEMAATASSSNNDCVSVYSSAIREHKRKRRDGKWIAVLTEPDACESTERADQTFLALQSAVSSGCIDLVSIRVSPETGTKLNDSMFQQRLISLVRRVRDLRQNIGAEFLLVVNDNIQAAVDGGADGVHVKEKNLDTIQAARKSLEQASKDHSSDAACVVGTSCHSIESALLANTYRPDYLFVGTCYMTQSHPEKTTVDMLEGPLLPGKVKQAILEQNKDHSPIVFAIGGIDEINANEPVQLGADGVAAIRSILCSADPAQVAQTMKEPYSIEDGAN